MTLFEIVLLATVQGITEFLPVSSSGHLVLAQHLLGVEAPGILLEVALHIGTLLSVIVVFFKDIRLLALACWTMVNPSQRSSFGEEVYSYRRVVLFLLLGSLPAAFLGVFFKDFFLMLFASTRLVGVALLVTGCILMVVTKLKGYRTMSQLDAKGALAVGLAQGLAITPGISRSGMTISAALLMGFDRETATRFSFLLSIPAILGAAILEIPTVVTASMDFPWWWILVGIMVAAGTGILAINSLVRALRHGKLHYFAYYVWMLGLVTLLVVR